MSTEKTIIVPTGGIVDSFAKEVATMTEAAMSTDELLELTTSCVGVEHSERDAKVDHCLEDFELDDPLDRMTLRNATHNAVEAMATVLYGALPAGVDFKINRTEALGKDTAFHVTLEE